METLRTAQQMYEYHKANNLGEIFKEKEMLKHYQLIEADLKPNEYVIVPFIGRRAKRLQNGKYESSSYSVFCLTNQRLMQARKGWINEEQQQVSLNFLNDVTMQKRLIMGYVIIDTAKEEIIVETGSVCVENIYKALSEALHLLKQSETIIQQPATITETNDKTKEQLQVLKGLYEQKVLTTEQFVESVLKL
uniref:YokE-like PH domain-containing protein n=1 Tax=Dulem virus 36 TaxID=3145754 RepID=A0AAU8B0D6_9CAUD